MRYDPIAFYFYTKRELVRNANYDNPEQARQDIFKYIEQKIFSFRLKKSIG